MILACAIPIIYSSTFSPPSFGLICSYSRKNDLTYVQVENVLVAMHPTHKYDAVDLSNHERDSDSITEVEESLIGDEKRWHHDDLHALKTKPSKRSRCLAVVKSFSWTLNTVLLLAITALLLHDQSRKSGSTTSEHEVGGDLTGVTPSCEHDSSTSATDNIANVEQLVPRSLPSRSTRPSHHTTRPSSSSPRCSMHGTH